MSLNMETESILIYLDVNDECQEEHVSSRLSRYSPPEMMEIISAITAQVHAAPLSIIHPTSNALNQPVFEIDGCSPISPLTADDEMRCLNMRLSALRHGDACSHNNLQILEIEQPKHNDTSISSDSPGSPALRTPEPPRPAQLPAPPVIVRNERSIFHEPSEFSLESLIPLPRSPAFSHDAPTTASPSFIPQPPPPPSNTSCHPPKPSISPPLHRYGQPPALPPRKNDASPKPQDFSPSHTSRNFLPPLPPPPPSSPFPHALQLPTSRSLPTSAPYTSHQLPPPPPRTPCLSPNFFPPQSTTPPPVHHAGISFPTFTNPRVSPLRARFLSPPVQQ